MQDRLEALIRAVYRQWKAEQPETAHPDEETLVCFLEGRLGPSECQQIKTHLVSCSSCAKTFALQARLDAAQELEVPAQLIREAKALADRSNAVSTLEIGLRLKDKIIELLKTTGDVLFGQELVPAPVLRSRQIKDFQDEVNIFKDFADVRVEIKIENRGSQIFDLSVVVKEKQTQKIMKDLRVTLLKDNLELESLLPETSKVIFEHIPLGKYTVEIASVKEKLATVLLDIKI